MKRLVFLSTLMVAFSAIAANADVINVYTTSDHSVIGTVTWTKTTASGLDSYLFKLSSLDSTYSGTTGLEGVFNAVGTGKKLSVSTGEATSGDGWWSDTAGGSTLSNSKTYFSTANAGTLDSATGYTVLNGTVMFARDGTWNSTTGFWSDTASSYLQGSWFSTTAKTAGTGNAARLAAIAVTTGGDVSYTGDMLLSKTGGGLAREVTFTTAAVPEPGTLAMLAGGLVGLLAYAWRKRK
jgi:hypothetical protein